MVLIAWRLVSGLGLVCLVVISGVAIVGFTAISIKKLVCIFLDEEDNKDDDEDEDEKIVVFEYRVRRERDGWIENNVLYLRPSDTYDFGGWTVESATPMLVDKEELLTKEQAERRRREIEAEQRYRMAEHRDSSDEVRLERDRRIQ